jgi:hypothetical protein
MELRLTSTDPDTNVKLASDSSAHSLIRSLKVSTSGGAVSGVLENIEEYNALLNALSDTSVSKDQMTSGISMAEGTTTGGNIFGGNSRVFCLPLMSGVLDTL